MLGTIYSQLGTPIWLSNDLENCVINHKGFQTRDKQSRLTRDTVINLIRLDSNKKKIESRDGVVSNRASSSIEGDYGCETQAFRPMILVSNRS